MARYPRRFGSPAARAQSRAAFTALGGFLPVLGAALSSVIESNTVTLSGLVGSPALTINGGQYSKNGAAYSSAATTVTNGDTLKLRVTSSATAGATASVVATIDGSARTFAVTTAAATGTPTPSPTLTISGTPAAAMVGGSDAFTPTISGGTAPYTLSLASGTLPPGRAVNGSARTVTGTYTTAGTYSYVLRATDSAGAVANLTVNLVVQAAQALIPWTPAMIGVDELYDASVASSMLNSAGTQAQPGEGVATWQSQTSNGRTAAQGTAAAQPILGADADRSPNGVRPLTFRGAQLLPTAARPSQLLRYTVFGIFRFKGGVSGTRYVVGAPGGAYNLLQSSSATAGGVRAFITSQDIETSTEERFRSFTQNVQDTGLTFTALQGREETFNTTASGKGLLTGERLVLGGTASGTPSGMFDAFGWGLVPLNVGRANEQRMQGYLAHLYSLAAEVLDANHPYRAAPPMVPAGTTSTLDWIELPAVAAPRQAFLGGMTELQADSYNRGVAPPTDNSLPWGFPFSLTTAERARLKAEMYGPVPIIMFTRFPNGFGYRGFRNIDSATGLAKNIGERFSGQNEAVRDLHSNVAPLGGGLIPGVWSPPPYWKTTSTYGFGRLWAGGTYARDVSLDSIRTSDPTQFAAQIEALASAQLDDLEYLHVNVAPVRGYEGPNEPISDVDNFYGTCQMSAAEYRALIRAVIPKIRNSAVLSTYNGQPNFVMLSGESYKGYDNAGTTFTDPSLLATGKTVLAEMSYQTFHEIPSIYQNPDYIRTRSWDWIASGRGKPSVVNEMWFKPGEYTDAERFSRVCTWQLHQLNLVRAPIVLPIIHAMKDIPVNNAAHDAIGYPLAHMRLPAPYGQDPSTPGDFDPSIPYGAFKFVKPNWHGALFVLGNIPVGSVIRKVDLPQGVSGIAAVGTIVGGKRRILVVNWAATATTLMTTLGSNATYNVFTYTATDAAVSAGSVSGPLLSMTFAPYTAYVITEA
ncbi:putative Ig domain-containing protein [Sphingomonas sp. Leaf10]|uniref:putative Ig domain-containing protein n=1 Tax=Sphingomonas sp. Leaf10 TaxID=1735676 RepID=UPI0006F9A311|nr:putative Ig domain-containing protein [Sphingomonas sp. Leaf10]KQM37605.1 hypothetical protein ASE59_14050 [Sphingomonas sp. Leaf10]